MALNDEIYITIVGSGTCMPSAHRGSPCIAIRFQTHYFLFDIGPGSLRSLSGLGINFHLLEGIWITHFHPDHTADLVHFLFATRYPKILQTRRPFSIMGPPGLKRFLNQLQSAYSPYLDLPKGLLTVQEVPPNDKVPVSWKDLSFKVASSNHTGESIAIRMETPAGKAIVYTGDTDFSQDIIRLSDSADVLIVEASFPEEEKVKGHLTPVEAGTIAREAGVKKVVLMHFYPECLGTDIGGACRKNFEGEIVVASDSLNLII